MCVAITMDPGSELTLDETVKMNRANADGLGVAWVKDGMVHWYKTTRGDLRQLTRLINHYKESPRLVHFRYATVGGTRADLCHPFEVGPLASCKPVDSTSLAMIHNGHWSRYKEVLDLLEAEDLLPDKGPWSDTRVAALMMHQDESWVEALGGRVATMDGEGAIRRWGDWETLREGVFVSNKSWDGNATYKRGGYTGYRHWKGWDWEDADWAAFEAEQRELIKLEMEGQGEACDPSVMYTWGPDGKNVEHIKETGDRDGQEQAKVKTQKRTRRDTQPLEGADNGVAGRLLPAPEGDSAEHDHSGKVGRKVSEVPFVHPYTGEVFKARPDGSVVKVATEHAPLPGKPDLENSEGGGSGGTDGGGASGYLAPTERGYYCEGDYEDLTHLNDDNPDAV